MMSAQTWDKETENQKCMKITSDKTGIDLFFYSVQKLDDWKVIWGQWLLKSALRGEIKLVE